MLNQYWVEKLREEQCYVTLVYPMDMLKSDSQKGLIKFVGVFEQYMANVLVGLSASLADQDKDERSGANADELLDVACSMGSFQALTHRCQENIKKIASDKEISVTQFDNDMHNLGFLFWETGYIHAANYALKMASVLLTHDVELSKHYRAQAAIKYLCAEYLHTANNYSAYILDCMSGGRGMRAFFSEDSKVDSQLPNPLTPVIATIFGQNEELPEYRRLAMLEMQPFFPTAITATGVVITEEKTAPQEVSHSQNQHALLSPSKINNGGQEDAKKLTALLNQRPPSPRK